MAFFCLLSCLLLGHNAYRAAESHLRLPSKDILHPTIGTRPFAWPTAFSLAETVLAGCKLI
jgi:hypothetical protein